MPPKNKNSNWHVAATLTERCEKVNETAAVELTFRQIRNSVLFSHTIGRMRDGEFVPTPHLRDDMLREYLVLLDKSAHLASSVRARWDDNRGRERLAASIAEVIGSKE